MSLTIIGPSLTAAPAVCAYLCFDKKIKSFSTKTKSPSRDLFFNSLLAWLPSSLTTNFFMKTSLFCLFFLLIGAGLTAQDAEAKLVSKAIAPTEAALDNGMRWNETTHDFGTITQGTPQSAEFVVTNSGEEPLIISNVKSTCGCTAATHAEGPILPGESTTVTATYNAKRPGTFRKSVKVTTNRSENPILLTVMGTVAE